LRSIAEVEYAEYGQRVRAAIVDAIVVYVVSGILIFGFSLFAFRAAGSPLERLFTSIAVFIAYAGPTLYYWVCYAEGGQTLGKMGGHIAVRRDADEETPIGYVRGFIRAAIPPFFWILIVPGLLDVLWPIWDRKKQTLHDKLVGSVVVQV
jgi:uncharacterized RDD family membrane protein YckC